MKLSEITPEWIAQTRDALGLRDVDIYTAIGMEQTRFSKSMRGIRAFKVSEREAILAFLQSDAATSRTANLAEIVRMFPELSESQKLQVEQIVREFYRLAPGRSKSDPSEP